MNWRQNTILPISLAEQKKSAQIRQKDRAKIREVHHEEDLAGKTILLTRNIGYEADKYHQRNQVSQKRKDKLISAIKLEQTMEVLTKLNNGQKIIKTRSKQLLEPSIKNRNMVWYGHEQPGPGTDWSPEAAESIKKAEGMLLSHVNYGFVCEGPATQIDAKNGQILWNQFQ
ncbi:hypothetical protein TURU_132489 [Turdus rufiventris]|nr:hypothetical protein TURU_132489 [Turdus rufiventris]